MDITSGCNINVKTTIWTIKPTTMQRRTLSIIVGLIARTNGYFSLFLFCRINKLNEYVPTGNVALVLSSLTLFLFMQMYIYYYWVCTAGRPRTARLRQQQHDDTSTSTITTTTTRQHNRNVAVALKATKMRRSKPRARDDFEFQEIDVVIVMMMTELKWSGLVGPHTVTTWAPSHTSIL